MDPLTGKRSSLSRLPQYLMNAMLAQATLVAVEVDMLRKSPFRCFLLPVYHERQIALKLACFRLTYSSLLTLNNANKVLLSGEDLLTINVPVQPPPFSSLNAQLLHATPSLLAVVFIFHPAVVS